MAILSFFRSPRAPQPTQKVPPEGRAASRVLAPELTDLDHQNLILEIRLANRQAFNQLYCAVHPKLTRFLGRHTKQAHVIEEVVNDTMMVVWQKAHEFRGESKVSTWIMGIAYHTMLKSFRRTEEFVDGESFWQSQQGQYSAQPNHPYEVSHHPAEEYETQEWLAQGLRLLADDQRVTLELAYIFGHSLEEIAEIMACPVSTVKARMFHARVKLRNVLPALGLPNTAAGKESLS
jgi:RNA polymerase sigma-70 factor, ECF subfamily